MAIHSTFKALGDETRCAIISMLAERDMTIAEIAGCFDITRAAIKKHLNVLEHGDLIASQAQGRERINRLKPAGLKAVADWVGHYDRFWDDRLNKLKSVIERRQDQ